MPTENLSQSESAVSESPVSEQPVPEPVASAAVAPFLAAEVTETEEPDESFADLLSEYDRDRARSSSRSGEGSSKQIQGTVVSLSADSVFVDIGQKIEGVLTLASLGPDGTSLKAGDSILVSVKGRNEEGYFDLTRQKVAQPKDWSAFEAAFADKATIAGTVTALVKGGFTVDVGVRAFMPASRSGVREASQMEKLVGQEIHCRIIKLEVEAEDIVVDRRVVAEEEERSTREQRYNEIKVGDVVSGTVRSLTDYGAFINLGNVDALLHIGEISWARIQKAADVLSVGQEIQVKVLSLDPVKHRIAVSLKQLQPHPWDSVDGRYKAGDRVSGTVTRLADFGAFIQLEPGIEGMVHLSEMSWAKKVRKPADMLKAGETVDAVILGVNIPERRISLGLKQTLGDPFIEMAQKYPVGATVEGSITSFTKFGAFVQIAEGVEGMIHVSEIVADKRIDHPQDVLRTGQTVTAQVIEVDREKRQFRLSMKRLIPTSMDEYFSEHHEGDTVTARILDIKDGVARVELGEGIHASCKLPVFSEPETPAESPSAGVDLSSLTSMLQAKWKGAKNSTSAAKAVSANTPPAAGQIRSFRLTRLDPALKQIEVELSQ
jgi:small subunit ribosomal protein S1